MEKLKHSNNNMARAILRSAIATTNNQLTSILSQILPNSALVHDKYGNICMCEYFNNNEMFNAFSATLKTINDAFFLSPMNGDVNGLMAQGYFITSYQGNLISLIEQGRISPDINIPLDPIFRLIFHDKHERDLVKNAEYTKLFEQGKISARDATKALKKEIATFDFEPYKDILVEYGYSGKDLILAKAFLTIGATGKKNTRIVDYLDVYSLYHYYIFRKRINRRFLKAYEAKPLSKSQALALFEKIAREEISIHCHRIPNGDNTYFDRKYMGMCSDAMDATRAKNITLDIFNGGSKACENVAGTIELIINISTPLQDKVNVENISMVAQENRSKPKFCSLKNTAPVVPVRRTPAPKLTTKVDFISGTKAISPRIINAGKVVDESHYKTLPISYEEQRRMIRERNDAKRVKEYKENERLITFDDIIVK